MVDSEGTSQQLDVITPCVSSSSSQSGTADLSSNRLLSSEREQSAGHGRARPDSADAGLRQTTRRFMSSRKQPARQLK